MNARGNNVRTAKRSGAESTNTGMSCEGNRFEVETTAIAPDVAYGSDDEASSLVLSWSSYTRGTSSDVVEDEQHEPVAGGFADHVDWALWTTNTEVVNVRRAVPTRQLADRAEDEILCIRQESLRKAAKTRHATAGDKQRREAKAKKEREENRLCNKSAVRGRRMRNGEGAVWLTTSATVTEHLEEAGVGQQHGLFNAEVLDAAFLRWSREL